MRANREPRAPGTEFTCHKYWTQSIYTYSIGNRRERQCECVLCCVCEHGAWEWMNFDSTHIFFPASTKCISHQNNCSISAIEWPPNIATIEMTCNFSSSRFISLEFNLWVVVSICAQFSSPTDIDSSRAHVECAFFLFATRQMYLIGNLIYSLRSLPNRCHRATARQTVIRLNFKLDFWAVPDGKWNSHVTRANKRALPARGHYVIFSSARLVCAQQLHSGGYIQVQYSNHSTPFGSCRC